VLNEGAGMQQDGTIAWEPVVQPSTLKTWHVMVAVFLFVCVIYGVVWWARRRPENNPGSLSLRGDHPDSIGRS
jgi:heme A synthase